MTKSPKKDVTDQFGGKDKLVDKLSDLLERGEESKDELKARLLSASNSKLLRLHKIASDLKEGFAGSREKLVEAILGTMNRVKDADYKTKLLAYTPGRLLDMYRSLSKKAKAKKAPPAPKATAGKKAPAKKKPKAA
jgi:hypothetical protein